MEGTSGRKSRTLDVKRCYQGARTEGELLADVYEQVVPQIQRSLSARKSPVGPSVVPVQSKSQISYAGG
jgi:hypothetical protein